MQVVISGATGFVGQALVGQLGQGTHRIKALSRRPDQASEVLGPAIEAVDLNDDDALRKAIDGADLVVNLAGENVSGGRWSRARKQRLWDSRVIVTERIVAAIEQAQSPPHLLISASAVGIYGDTGEEIASESSDAATGFLASLCVAWEETAARAETLGLRVLHLRMGVVMGQGGGALKVLLPLFRKGLGGPIGSGQQWMSWIHVEDLVQIVMAAMEDERFQGPINAVSPVPIRNSFFTEALASSLGTSSRMAVPGMLLRWGLGEASSMLLDSSRVDGERLRELGFEYSYPTLEKALLQVAQI
jgi:uncharacterized protein (TIGR01777 family)